MNKTKRWMAAALAATMVMGSTITVFATETDPTTPVTSGSTQGTGTSEGHVDTHVINVVLPTIPAGSTPFAYTMDAERLIQDTDGAKYANATFPEEASDTGVYFLTASTAGTTTYTKKDAAPDGYTGSDFATLPASPDADTYAALTEDQKTCYDVTTTGGSATYANTSEELKVTSKSSADVKLKVEVAVTSAATDIELVDTAPASTVTDPKLYLALKVGSEDAKAIKKGETTSTEVTIAGKNENFEKKVVDGAYVYAEKAGATTTVYKKVSSEPNDYVGSTFADLDDEITETAYEALDDDTKEAYTEETTTAALTWNETTISLTGAVSKASAKDLTAPVLTVTWKYTDPADTQTTPSTQPSLSAESVSASSNVVTVSDGTVSSIVLIKSGATTETALNSPKHYNIVEDEITFSTSVLTNNVGGKIKVSFTEGGSAELAIE